MKRVEVYIAEGEICNNAFHESLRKKEREQVMKRILYVSAGIFLSVAHLMRPYAGISIP